MAKVVEAEGAEAGSVEGELVAAAKRGAVEVAAAFAEEDERVVGCGRAEAGEGLGDLGCHRDGAELPLLSVVSARAR